MTKITFRANDELAEQLEALEISKSEAMREALRSYLEGGAARGGQSAERAPIPDATRDGTVDDLIRDRVDELLGERLREVGLEPVTPDESRVNGRERGVKDVTVTVSLEDGVRTRESSSEADISRHVRAHEDNEHDGADAGHDGADANDGSAAVDRADEQDSHSDGTIPCDQCGEPVADDHVFCPNCGEQIARRSFCECGDEIRSDWSFCPSCGRRTPTADVLGRDTPS